MDNEFRIAEILKERGMTQTDLAGQIGISRVGLSKAINGNTTITTLRKIAAALGISKERVRQVEQQAFAKVKAMGAELGLEDFLED